MWKSILAGTVALALSSAGVAFAQQRPGIGPAQPSPPAPQVSPAPQSAPQQAAPAQQRPSVQPQDDARAVAEGRIAELRSRLSLTPEQEKNWSAFEQAYRDFAQLRAERWRDLAAARRSDNPVENFQSWADFASRRVNAMKRLADATAPFYQSLDQNQQRRFLDQIYAWHPRLARLSNRLAARGREGDDGGWRGRGPGQGCDFHRGYGMRGHGMGRGDDQDGPGRGYGRGPGPGTGPHWGWRGRRGDWDDRDRDDDGGPGYGMGRGMGPYGGWHGHGRHGGWDDDDEDSAGPGRGMMGRGMMGRGMGPCGGGHGRGRNDWDDRGGYESGPHHGMCPRWGSRDRDDTDGSSGGWRRQDWRGDSGSIGPNEERL
ncbi:MAG: Spy/CpxP family protein refolding chaperone [Rhodoplanes sp.]